MQGSKGKGRRGARGTKIQGQGEERKCEDRKNGCTTERAKGRV
jgi:hypothetical protein